MRPGLAPAQGRRHARVERQRCRERRADTTPQFVTLAVYHMSGVMYFAGSAATASRAWSLHST